MSNEITVRCSLQIQNGNLNYANRPGSFKANQNTVGGPSPGEVTVTVHPGTDISLTQLTNPSMCRLINLDPTNYVTYGIYDSSVPAFYPFGELGPGEEYVVRLSRFIQQDFIGTGTGSPSHKTTFHMKANTASCRVVVDAFEK